MNYLKNIALVMMSWTFLACGDHSSDNPNDDTDVPGPTMSDTWPAEPSIDPTDDRADPNENSDSTTPDSSQNNGEGNQKPPSPPSNGSTPPTPSNGHTDPPPSGSGTTPSGSTLDDGMPMPSDHHTDSPPTGSGTTGMPNGSASKDGNSTTNDSGSSRTDDTDSTSSAGSSGLGDIETDKEKRETTPEKKSRFAREKQAIRAEYKALAGKTFASKEEQDATVKALRALKRKADLLVAFGHRIAKANPKNRNFINELQTVEELRSNIEREGRLANRRPLN